MYVPSGTYVGEIINNDHCCCCCHCVGAIIGTIDGYSMVLMLVRTEKVIIGFIYLFMVVIVLLLA